MQSFKEYSDGAVGVGIKRVSATMACVGACIAFLSTAINSDFIAVPLAVDAGRVLACRQGSCVFCTRDYRFGMSTI